MDIQKNEIPNFNNTVVFSSTTSFQNHYFVSNCSLFEWNFAGTSIRLTANNLYRAALCLFPPSAEECISMCRSGFNDALRYLISNGKLGKLYFVTV